MSFFFVCVSVWVCIFKNLVCMWVRVSVSVHICVYISMYPFFSSPFTFFSLLSSLHLLLPWNFLTCSSSLSGHLSSSFFLVSSSAPEISGLHHPSLVERGVSPSLVRAMKGHPQESPARHGYSKTPGLIWGPRWGKRGNKATVELRTWWFYGIRCDFGSDLGQEMQHSVIFPKLVSVFFLRQLSPSNLTAGDTLHRELPMLNVKWHMDHMVFGRKHVLTIGYNCLTYTYCHLGPSWSQQHPGWLQPWPLNWTPGFSPWTTGLLCVHVSVQVNVLELRFYHSIGKLLNSRRLFKKDSICTTQQEPGTWSRKTFGHSKPATSPWSFQTPQVFPTNTVVTLLPAPNYMTICHCRLLCW